MTTTGITAIDEAMDKATSVRLIGRRLGTHLLDHAEAIGMDLDSIAAPTRDKYLDVLRHLTFRLGADELLSGTGSFGVRLRRALDDLEPTPHLAVIGFLQGLCLGALGAEFKAAYGPIELQRGDPFPLPDLPRNEVCTNLTPDPVRTIRRERPLARVRWEVFDAAIKAVLDFSDRDNLDAACWNETESNFRRVGVIHPFPASELQLPAADVTDTDWFGVGPKPAAFNVDTITAHLETLANCGAALLPELCAPTPDVLADVIADRHDQLPDLIVAGSAHTETATASGPTRFSNTANVYLRGAHLFSHDKVHPFETDSVEVLGFEATDKLPERLSRANRRLTIACGDRIRMTVVICADSFDADVVNTIHRVCANFVLVPTFTFSWAGVRDLDQVANQNQGAAVAVNGSAYPFTVMVVGPEAQVPLAFHDHPDSDQFPVCGTVDPSRPNVPPEWCV